MRWLGNNEFIETLKICEKRSYSIGLSVDDIAARMGLDTEAIETILADIK